ncbi:hypothetical protein B296_00014471 [Ensete ventricosum]|uniref:Uncharacterized protein n=1 Tax=Ensete ventricosum TaxID=4639 RepID=A0A427A7P2_ENSVE|nr:hypothetical protein B296_00014471 [Ensete ventricosum]
MASTTTADSLRVDREKDWDFHLRSLSSNARDSSSASDPASDPYILQSVCLRAPYLLPFDSASSRLSRQEDLRDRQRRGIGGAGGAGIPTNQQALPTMRLGSAAVTDIQWGSFAGGCWLGRLSSILGTSEPLVL